MSADIASVTIDKLRNEIARLKGQTNWVCTCGGTDCEGQRQNAELEATLIAVYDANQRGIKAWQQAHPNKAMVWPDQAKLVEWLLRENAKLQAHAERVGEANDLLAVENATLRAAAVEVCAVARVWVTVWGDKLSAESVNRLEQLEKQILKETQP